MYLYAIASFSAAIVFFGLYFGWNRLIPFKIHLYHTLIVGWSALIYLSAALEILPEIVPYFYIDWIVSTPLMLLAFAASAAEDDLNILRGAAALQVLVILAGAAADVSGELIFFVIGTVIAIGIFVIIWTFPLRHREPQYEGLAVFLTIVWTVYPIVWILENEGFIGQTLFTFLLVVVPMVSKIGFGVIDLYLTFQEERRDRVILN